jgi:cysteine dioxygenase
MDGLTSRADLQIVEELLREANVERDDMVEACKFSTQHYARNELAKSPWYQLLVICWRGGQSSPIHDHFGSACGVRVVDGIATETLFAETSPGLVRPVRELQHACGEVCVTSDADIHLITNEQADQDLITLHLYSPPLKMRFYELERATV